MNNYIQKNSQIIISLFLVFIFIFLVGCNSKSIEENPMAAATITKITLPSSTLTATFTPTISPTITPSSTKTITSTPTSTPTGNAKGVLVGSVKWPSGIDEKILFLDLEKGDFYQIGNDGYKLHDISPDGKRILYSVSTELFVMNFDGSGSYLLRNDFDNDSELGAFWSVDDQIIFIKKTRNKEGVFRINSDGTEEVKILEGRLISRLFRVKNNKGVYWIEGYPNLTNGTWWTSIDGKEELKLNNSIIISSSGNYLINIHNFGLDSDTIEIIYAEDVKSFLTVGNYEANSGYIKQEKLFISDTESKIFIQESICNPKCDRYANFLISNTGELIKVINLEVGEIWFYGAWSPDDGLFLFNQVLRENDGFHFMPTLLDLTTYELTKYPNYNTKDMVFEILWVPITK